MKKNNTGFTLFELLIVIAIISLLAAILYPVFASARHDANKAVTFSNLRQCGLALTMYCDDYDGPRSMPVPDVAKKLLANVPTCDPSDTWRSSCSEDYGAPLIGSYAYVNYIDGQPSDLFAEKIPGISNPTVMAVVYYADPVPAPYVGDIPALGIADSQEYYYPNAVVRLKLDGSVAIYHDPLPKTAPVGHLMMSWSDIFGY